VLIAQRFREWSILLGEGTTMHRPSPILPANKNLFFYLSLLEKQKMTLFFVCETKVKKILTLLLFFYPLRKGFSIINKKQKTKKAD